MENINKNFSSPVPACIEEAIKYLKVFFKKDIEEFKAMEEGSFLVLGHMTEGQQIRNKWNLWVTDEHKKNDLVKYFNKMGIYHADDMSSIILVSFHRSVSGKPINVKQQVLVHKKYEKN